MKKASPAPAPSPIHNMRRDAIAHLTQGRFGEGIALLEKAAALAPQSGELQNDLGTAYWQSGAPALAETHYKKALQLAPRNGYVLNSYGTFQLEQRRFDEAGTLLKAAAAALPGNAEVLNNLGLYYDRSGDTTAARKCFIEAIQAQPRWANPHVNIADMLRDAERFDLAERAYRQALAQDPRHVHALRGLATIMKKKNRTDDAIALLENAIALHPEVRLTWFQYLDVLEKTNNLGKMSEKLALADQLFPGNALVVLHKARLMRRNSDSAGALALLAAASVDLIEDSEANAAFFYELGQLYDREDDAEKAFNAFTIANRCRALHAPSRFTDDVYRVFAERLLRDLTPAVVNGPLPASAAEPSPVFLIGFPRSGTTLLDQILASHPDITVSEERPASHEMIGYFLKKFPAGNKPGHMLYHEAYPRDLTKLTAEDVTAMRDIFWASHGGQPEKKIFVDKLPLNILQIAIIKRVFPKARFILALRHPCDSVLSCFMQDFNLNNAMHRFCDINSSADFYAETFGIWDIYNRVLNLDVHTIRYEDVVADFKPTVASLLQFLGVEWNDAVLDYDKTAREKKIINTPSYHQVTQKIYTRASGRWLRYRQQLAPILDILRPHAQAHGYAMDEE